MKPHAIARYIFWIVAAFYAYGALVHILNMLSLTGFNWGEAPTKWQALDIVFLILDVTVVMGLLSGARIGIWAFLCAALSQIALYTIFREWVLDVPESFRPSPEEIGYLDTLVMFHVITIAVVATALWLRHRRAQTA